MLHWQSLVTLVMVVIFLSRRKIKPTCLSGEIRLKHGEIWWSDRGWAPRMDFFSAVRWYHAELSLWWWWHRDAMKQHGELRMQWYWWYILWWRHHGKMIVWLLDNQTYWWWHDMMMNSQYPLVNKHRPWKSLFFPWKLVFQPQQLPGSMLIYQRVVCWTLRNMAIVVVTVDNDLVIKSANSIRVDLRTGKNPENMTISMIINRDNDIGTWYIYIYNYQLLSCHILIGTMIFFTGKK